MGGDPFPKNIHSAMQFFYKVIKKKKMGIGVKCKPQIHSKTNILTPTPRQPKVLIKPTPVHGIPHIILLFISFISIRPIYVVTWLSKTVKIEVPCLL